jgi:hypothetical protein
MKKFILLNLLVVSFFCFADEIKQPKPPALPQAPVTPGSNLNIQNTIQKPALPPPPISVRSKENKTASEVENYILTVTKAYSGMDIKNSVADTINYAQYILFSDNSITLKLFYKNDWVYTYFLRNPKSKIQTGTDSYRTTYDIMIQAGSVFLTETYSGEVYSVGKDIKSIVITGGGAVVASLEFTKK